MGKRSFPTQEPVVKMNSLTTSSNNFSHIPTQSFNDNDFNTQALIKQLQAFQVLNLVQPKPSLDESLSRLNQIIKSKKVPIARIPTNEEKSA